MAAKSGNSRMTDERLEQIRVEVDRLRAIESAAAHRDLEDAIEFAAGELPDGWIIRIDTENGSCCIEVGRPHDDYWVPVERYDREPLAELVRNAVEVAKADHPSEPEQCTSVHEVEDPVCVTWLRCLLDQGHEGSHRSTYPGVDGSVEVPLVWDVTGKTVFERSKGSRKDSDLREVS